MGFYPGWVQQPDSVTAFGRFPVLSEGRIKPLDSVARSTLLVIQGYQRRHRRPDKRDLTPDEWLLDVLFCAREGGHLPDLRTSTTPDLLSLIGRNDANLAIRYEERLSFNEIAPHFADLEAQEKLAEPVEAQSRTRFQSSVVQLYGNLSHYLRLKRAILPDGSKDFLGELLRLQENLSEGIEAVQAKEAGKPHDEAKASAIIQEGQKFVALSEGTDLLAIPPDDGDDPNAWHNCGHALLETFGKGEVNPAVHRHPHVARGPPAGDEPLFVGALHRLGLGGPVPGPRGIVPQRDRRARRGPDRLRHAPDRPPPGARGRHAGDDARRPRLELLARTHVVVGDDGYASTFLAGFLAVIYIVRGVLTRTLDRRPRTRWRAWSTGSSASPRSSASSARPSAASGPTSPGAGSGAGTRRRTAP
jgi:hypothetical protein